MDFVKKEFWRKILFMPESTEVISRLLRPEKALLWMRR